MGNSIGTLTAPEMTVGEQVAFLNTILESVTEYSIVAKDLNGDILAWNEGAHRIYGYEAEDVIGKSAFLLHHPDDVASGKAQAILEEVRKAGQWSGELRRKRKNGSVFNALVTITLRHAPDGQPVGFTMTSQDLTESQRILEEGVRRQNAELTKTTAFLNNVLESSTEHSVIAMDLEGKILNWNAGARRNYGYSAEDMVGKRNARSLYTPEDIAAGRAADFMQTALSAGKAEAVFERVRQDGRRFTASVALSLRRDAAGTPIGYVLISKDITGQNRLEEQLRRQNEELEEQNRRVHEANRLKSEFLANISHELRTPLNAIIGFSELLHDGRAGAITVKQKSYIGDVLTSAGHLLQLINDVLDLSKVESGKMEFFPEAVDPTKLVSEVSDILRTLTAHKRITLRTEIEPRLTELVLDPAKLKQVLFNYLSNALKFTGEKGRVTIRMRAAGSAELRLEAEDTGIGIRPEDIPRLFAEFQQLDATASKKYQGTGLGLALTKRIVEAQGGTVGVTSTPGKGSIFSAILPRIDHANLNRLAAPPKKEPSPGAHRVLVIEDAARDGEWLVATLEGAGYDVESAATGAQVLRWLSERPFDAITLDLMLPDMSGWDVLRRVRADGINRAVPVVVVTVLADKGAGMGFRIHDFLAKPVEQRDLLEALNRARVHTAAKGLTILLVDDNRRDLKLFKAALEQNGFKTTAKSSVMAALRAAEKPPDIVVLDLVMPNVDGFEFLQRFRATEHGRTTPVIVLTAKDLAGKERDLLAAMAQGVIAKGTGSVRALLAELSMTLVHGSAEHDPASADNGGPAQQRRVKVGARQEGQPKAHT